MARRKKENEVAPVGDPFFDQPSEEYWTNRKSQQEFITQSIKEYESKQHIVETDFKELNTLMIPLTELRLKIAELQTMGLKKMPLGDLLLTIQDVYRENKDE